MYSSPRLGVVCYADDVLLMAPTRQAMEQMLRVVEKFAADSNVKFSTDPNPAKSQSKCILMVGKKKREVKPVPLQLCGSDPGYEDLLLFILWLHVRRSGWSHGSTSLQQLEHCCSPGLGLGVQPSTIQSNLSRGIILWILHDCIEICGKFYGYCMDVTLKTSMF